MGSAEMAPRRLTVCWMFAGIGLSTYLKILAITKTIKGKQQKVCLNK
jgi:hypothetical protein